MKVSQRPLQRRVATRRRYLRQAFGHPLNVSVIVVLAVFALAYGAFPWFVVGVALEVLALSALLHADFFRARAERQLLDSELYQLRLQLDGSQLRELQRLEELAAAAQKATLRAGARLAGGDLVQRLLERFVRLSLAHKSGRELIASTDRRALDHEICQLEANCAAAPALRRLQQRRLELARRRVARLEIVAERVEVVAQELAAISEAIHFLHEQALAPPDPISGDPPWAEDLERLLGDLGEEELALHELDAIPA